ncbi:uncharacterized protein ACRADG_004387 [Cochliomyia hominivorax]
MKLLYAVITLFFIKCLLIKPLKADNSTTPAQNKLKLLYKNYMTLIDKKYAEKFQNLSQHILKAPVVQSTSTPKIRIFKLNIEDFLDFYDFYNKYGLYNNLIQIFTDITLNYKRPGNDAGALYVNNILRNYGYYEINSKYEQDYVKYIKERVIPEFEDFAKKLSQKGEFSQKLLRWLELIKRCSDYWCYNEQLYILTNMLYTPKYIFLEAVEENLKKINYTYIIKANEVMKSVLKDSKLKQLESGLRGNITKDIDYFIKQYSSNKNINQVKKLLQYFNDNISLKYYNNGGIPTRDRQLIKEIFDKNGFAKMEIIKKLSLYTFIHQEFVNIFSHFKASLSDSDEDRIQANAFNQQYENIISSKTPESQMKAFNTLLAMKRK